MITGLLLALALTAQATEPPFYTREVKSLLDVGALNQNSRALADAVRRIETQGAACSVDGTCAATTGGTGASLTADQTFSGANTFAGTFLATGLVKISTGFVINFASSLGYTTTQTSYLAAVTGSTGTFTVVGTTVACSFTGHAGNASANMMGATIGMDSNNAIIPGTSSTIGVAGAYQWNTNSPGNLSFHRTFQVTPGQHSFYLLLRTISGTLTFPTTTGISSVAQWECKEMIYR